MIIVYSWTRSTGSTQTDFAIFDTENEGRRWCDQMGYIFLELIPE